MTSSPTRCSHFRAETGERVWHFQAVKHDLWDRDLPAPHNLVTVNRGNKLVDAVAQITKAGVVFVFDRVTGKPLFPMEYHPAPGVRRRRRIDSETQAFPLKPPPFARQILTEDMLTHRTAEAHQAVLDVFRKVRSAGQFVPPSREGTVVFPGFDGGGEWGGTAFDPASGLLYVNSNEMPWILRLIERPKVEGRTTGRNLYLAYCATCHHADLQGSPPDFPALTNISARFSEEEIRALVYEGRGRMPAFTKLPRDEITALDHFLLTGEDVPVDAPASESPWPFGLKYTIDGYNRFLDPDGYPGR
jgi:quinoprotein glucose dehydrogenase